MAVNPVIHEETFWEDFNELVFGKRDWNVKGEQTRAAINLIEHIEDHHVAEWWRAGKHTNVMVWFIHNHWDEFVAWRTLWLLTR